jgi:hypothetical protein
MKLFVGPMDVVIEEVAPDGQVRVEGEGWVRPSLQERRAIIYAAQSTIDELTELIDFVGRGAPGQGSVDPAGG